MKPPERYPLRTGSENGNETSGAFVCKTDRRSSTISIAHNDQVESTILQSASPEFERPGHVSMANCEYDTCQQRSLALPDNATDHFAVRHRINTIVVTRNFAGSQPPRGLSAFSVMKRSGHTLARLQESCVCFRL